MSAPQPCGLVPTEANYPDIPTSFAAIQAHAWANEYAFCKRDTRPNRVVFNRDQSGEYDPKGKDPEVHDLKRRKTSTKKCGCRIRVVLQLAASSS